MSFEQQFRAAVQRACAVEYKSANQLAQAAGIDQGSLSKFLRGGGLKIDTASRLLETLGGVVVFPWDESGNASQLARMQKALDEMAAELDQARRDCETWQAKYDAAKDIARDIATAQSKQRTPIISVDANAQKSADLSDDDIPGQAETA